MGRTQTKKITLNPGRRKDARKLTRLLDDGWVIVSQHKRGLLSWKPGWVDYILTR